MPAGICPSDQELRAFQLGDLPEPSLNNVAEHLERCTACESKAQQLDTEVDPILALLREPSTKSPAGGKTLALPATKPAVRLPDQRPAGATAAYPFLSPPGQPDEIGRLGNYRVLRLLGKGGMAFVFHAEDLSLGRPVALKVMKPDLGSDADGWQRFLREARIMASVKHDHLVTVYQAGQEGQVVYLAMELLGGESLAAWMERKGKADVTEVLRLGREIASGLAVIHGHGLIHRDIKPDNIWLEAPSGRVKILDFGLARFVKDDIQLTQTGTVMGTPAFMAPEQARGQAVDGRTDLFSLGCVLYALATGSKPFHADNTMAVLTALAVDNPRPVHEINPAIPPALSELVTQLLAKKPEDRPTSAELVRERLAQIEANPDRTFGAQTLVRVAASTQRWKIFPGNYWLKYGLAAVALVIVGFLLSRLSQSGPSNPPPASRSPPSNPSAVYASVPGAIYLSDMKEIESEAWPWRGPLPPGKTFDEPGDWPAPKGGARVRINDKVSLHGLWMHLPPGGGGKSSVTYRLGTKYSRFNAEVSLNDGPLKCIPMTFAVYGDDKLLWDSKPVTSQKDLQPCTFSVKGVDKLKLQVSAEGDERGTHAVWIEPYVTK
jgi:serine/threonine protein kinase